MSSSTQLHTILVPWRKVCAALPLLALVGSPILFVPQAAPSHGLNSAAASSDSPVVIVPDVALTLPAPRRISTDRLLGEAAPKAPSQRNGGVPGSLSPAPLDSTGIPVRALEGYRAAARLVNASDPACHIDWALLAAIGRVESNHARFGGNQLDSAGTARPGIIGLPLDGSSGTALIRDSDGGALDRDPVYDRAVGPMQFIPSTWRVVGADANGDGVKDPQNMADAATASAIYLCSGPGDLSQPADLNAAILRYNASGPYAQMVTDIAASYRLGVSVLPASDLAPASLVPATSAAKPVQKKPATTALASATAASKAAGQPPSTTTGSTSATTGSTSTTATIPPSSTTAQPSSTTSTTVPPTPATTSSTSTPTCTPTGTASPTTSTASATTTPTPCVTQTTATSTPLTQEVCATTPPGVATCTTVAGPSTGTTTPAP